MYVIVYLFTEMTLKKLGLMIFSEMENSLGTEVNSIQLPLIETSNINEADIMLFVFFKLYRCLIRSSITMMIRKDMT